MIKTEAKFPKYADDEAHIIRRLGGAVVAQWDNLPSDVQELLVKQAGRIFDADVTVQLEQTIQIFLTKNAGWKNPDA